MRAAAPAQFPVATHGVWHLLQAWLLLVATATLVAWLGWHAQWRWQSLAAVLPAGVALVWWSRARWIRRRGEQPRDHLIWDGAAWRLDGHRREPGQPELILDGGAWMLLRWQGRPERPGRDVHTTTRWLPLSAADDPARWHEFRVAVVTAAKGKSLNMVVDPSA